MENLKGKENREGDESLKTTLQILTCRTSVLRVTRSTGLYNRAVKKKSSMNLIRKRYLNAAPTEQLVQCNSMYRHRFIDQ